MSFKANWTIDATEPPGDELEGDRFEIDHAEVLNQEVGVRFDDLDNQDSSKWVQLGPISKFLDNGEPRIQGQLRDGSSFEIVFIDQGTPKRIECRITPPGIGGTQVEGWTANDGEGEVPPTL